MIEITGTIVLAHSAIVDPKECICCPGHASHVHQISFELPEYENNNFPKHFGRRLEYWLQSNYPFKSLEGRKIRITAELLP